MSDNVVRLATHEPEPVQTAARVSRFFVLTFAFTWTLQLPGVLAQRGWLPGGAEPYMPLVILGVFGPSAAATLLTARSQGRAGVRRLFAGLLAFRVHPIWYAVALLLPGILLTLGCATLRSAGYGGEIFFMPAAERLVAGLLISVAEEVGWRGYALPRLQDRYGPVAASGVIGILWTLWHIPMFLGAGISLALLPLMLLHMLGGSLTFTWIYNRTGGSLLMAVLAHFGAHLNNSHLALPSNVLPVVVHAILFALIGVLAVALDKRAFPLGFSR